MSDQPPPPPTVGRGRARTLKPRTQQATAETIPPAPTKTTSIPDFPVPPDPPASYASQVPVSISDRKPSQLKLSTSEESGDNLSLSGLSISSRDYPVRSPAGPLQTSTRPLIETATTTSSGSKLKPVTLLSNYVHVSQRGFCDVYQYHINFEPNIVSDNVRTRLVLSKGSLFNDAFIYDKQSTIMSICLIPGGYAEFSEIQFKRKIRIKIQKVSQFTIGDPEMCHFLNIQLNVNFQALGWVQILRNYFDFSKKSNIMEHKIDVMPGITSSIRHCKLGMLLTADTVHKVIQTASCLEDMKAMASRWFQVEREFIGAIVITRYNNRTYRVCSIDRNATPMNEFGKKNGDKINFIEYYLQNYGVQIYDKKQPLFVVTPSSFEKNKKPRKIYLVPELCFTTGITEKMKTKFNMRKALVQKTQLEPANRVKRYREFLSELNSNTKIKEELKKWNITYDNDLLKIPGKVLPPELIHTENDQTSFDQRSADFTKELRDKKMFKSSDLNNWHVICNRNDNNDVKAFLTQLKSISVQFGIKYNSPQLITIMDDNPKSYLNYLLDITESDIILIVMPVAGNKRIYDDIKQHLCCEVGIPSQCVLIKTLSKRNLSVVSKILIQMVVKIGAEPYVLGYPSYLENVMVVGFDVFHKKTDNKKSLGAFVASLNNTFSSWFSKANFHTSMEEMSSLFSNNFSMAFRSYYNRNKTYPSQIIVFRDGVSECRYKQTLESEFASINRKVREIAPKCKISFVCINKRVITRFFQTTGNDNRLNNPLSGTVVDTDIVSATLPQFFLVSQSTIEGTVSPASYDIVQEGIGWDLEKYQQLTYKLCHMYYNWTGLISVPAPCQYAHKLANLVGGNLYKTFSTKLSEKLFFL